MCSKGRVIRTARWAILCSAGFWCAEWDANAMIHGETDAGTVQTVKSDRISVGPDDVVCITSVAAPQVIERVEQSGEDLKDWTVEAFGNDLAVEMVAAFQHIGKSDMGPRHNIPRMVVGSSMRAARDGCRPAAHVVAVAISIEPFNADLGYRVSISAQQGHQRYAARIDRSAMIKIPMQGRAYVPLDAVNSPDGHPFWDINHDVFKLRRAFIAHVSR